MNSDSDPLKVAITHTRFSYTGGIEKYIYSLVERLLEAGHHVHYFCHRFEAYDHPNLHFHRVRWQRFPKSLRVRSFDRALNRALRGQEFDLVHGFTKTSRQDLYTDGSGTLEEFLAATKSHWPSWWRRLYAMTPHQRAIRDMERARFQRGALIKVVPMAQFVAEQITSRYPIEPERVEVVYNGVETEVFHPRFRERRAEWRRQYGLPKSAPVLLFVGNDYRRKGLVTALEALREDHLASATLAVAGHDNHQRHYQSQAQAFGDGDRVVWLGAVREIREVFAASDLFVFPTRYDVFGNVGLEALATGLPAVLSARSGVSELLWSRNVGDSSSAGRILSDATSASELAQHAADLLNPDGYAERSAAARRLAERYSWEIHFERMESIYREVAREKAASQKQTVYD